MAYCVHYHNKDAYMNKSESEVYGPLDDRPAAISYLHKLAESIDDPLCVVDEDNGYLGYDCEALEAAGRSLDLSYEIWAEIIEMTPP